MLFSITRDITVLENNDIVRNILQKKKKSHPIRFLHKYQYPTITTGFSVLSWTGTAHSSLTLTSTPANGTRTLSYPSLGFLHTSPPGPSLSHLWSRQSYAGDDFHRLPRASHTERSSSHPRLTIVSLSGKATVMVRAKGFLVWEHHPQGVQIQEANAKVKGQRRASYSSSQ